MTAQHCDPGFSVRAFARTARGSHRAALNLDAYAAAPLPGEVVQVVDLLGRLERGVMAYLRSVLVTPTHNDARVTAFLVTWAYEKYWIADALERVVGAQPADARQPTPGLPRLHRAWHALVERVEPISESVVANLIGDEVVAVHVAAAAIDEWITQSAYERLAEASGNAEFSRTVARLLEVKHRHGAFFATEARARLAASAAARRLARRRIGRARLPLGSHAEPPALVAELLAGLIPAAQLAVIDVRASTLPGLEGLQPATRSAARARKATR